MTNTYNIAAIEGNVMVPVFSENGSLMAYLLSADPTGTLQELYSCMSILRGYPESTQRIPREYCYPKDAFGCTGQPIIQSFLKTKKMAKAKSTSGASADRIKNDPAFERTRENNAEFARAGKAAKLLRTIFQIGRASCRERV